MAASGKLNGKVAIVTGAGSSGPGWGTGKAMSILFAREGARVVLVDMFEDRARETLNLIEKEGGKASVHVVDLSDLQACAGVIEHAMKTFGGIDILINNAALTSGKSILDTSIEFLQKCITVNLEAPFVLCQAAIPEMIKRGGGSIINITSTTAIRGQGGKGTTAYAAAKAGLLGMMVDVADAYGKDNIRVNALAPGIIKTPMRASAIAASGRDPETFDLSHKTCLNREGDAWDIAHLALFLCTNEASYLTGLHIPVDGGICARSH